MRYTARRRPHVTKDIGRQSDEAARRRPHESDQWHNNPIEGSKPRETRFKSNRHTDLPHEYVLRVRSKPPTPNSHQRRHTVTDIDGTVPSPHLPRCATPTTSTTSRKQASWRPRYEPPARPPLRRPRRPRHHGRVRRREGGPHEPALPERHGTATTIRTKPLRPRPSPGLSSLYTDDILGAKSAGGRPPRCSRRPRSRATGGTPTSSATSAAPRRTRCSTPSRRRRTNPLNPAYRSLDGDILRTRRPDFSHIYDHFGPSPTGAAVGARQRAAASACVSRLVLNRRTAGPARRRGKRAAAPGSARSTGRSSAGTPHDRREAQQDAATGRWWRCT